MPQIHHNKKNTSEKTENTHFSEKSVLKRASRYRNNLPRSLEEDQLTQRQVYAEVPPRAEYTLTETGLSLMPHILLGAGTYRVYIGRKKKGLFVFMKNSSAEVRENSS